MLIIIALSPSKHKLTRRASALSLTALGFAYYNTLGYKFVT